MTSVKQVHQVSGLPTFSRGTHIFSRSTTKPIVVAQHLPVRRGYIVVVHQLVGAARLIHVWVSLFLLVLAPASLQLRPQAEPLQGGRCARRMHIHQRLRLDLLREMILWSPSYSKNTITTGYSTTEKIYWWNYPLFFFVCYRRTTKSQWGSWQCKLVQGNGWRIWISYEEHDMELGSYATW
jgi:hypothetical protein